MKNQQWQLGPETVIVSRNKKKGEGGGERERLQGKLSLVIKQLVNLEVKRNYKNKCSREGSSRPPLRGARCRSGSAVLTPGGAAGSRARLGPAGTAEGQRPERQPSAGTATATALRDGHGQRHFGGFSMRAGELASKTLGFAFHVSVLQNVKVFFGKQALYFGTVGG